MKPRFIAGPPGTGKTTTLLLIYKKLLKEDYPPEKIVILSHTNVAANQIKEAVLKLPEMQGRGFTLKSMKYKTCNNILVIVEGRLLRKEKFDVIELETIGSNIIFCKLDPQTDIERKHKFYRYISDARGHGKTLEEYWKICNKDSYKPYTIELIKTLYEIYTDYKKHKIITNVITLTWWKIFYIRM